LALREEPLAPAELARRWALVLPHRPELLAIARRRVDNLEDAEDIVSTALLRTVQFRNLDGSRVGAFLCTTVMRLAADVHRQRASQLGAARRYGGRPGGEAPIDERVCDEAEARWLYQELGSAPARERQVLHARMSGVSASEVADRLGLTAKAAENAFTRLRSRAHMLVSATLAGLAIVLGFGRRPVKPAIVAAPAVALAAFGLAFVTPALDDLAPTTPVIQRSITPAAAVLAPEPAADEPIKTSSSPWPSTETASPSGGGALVPERNAAPPPEVVAEIKPSDVHPSLGLVGGGAKVEEHQQDQTFEESLQYCLDRAPGVLKDPLYDPCRPESSR
jgi:RNA polymerase sigma factor (sigma-70 family)